MPLQTNFCKTARFNMLSRGNCTSMSATSLHTRWGDSELATSGKRVFSPRELATGCNNQ